MSTGPNGWIDVSVPISDGMLHWPGNPPVSLRRVLAIEHGDGANVSEVSLGVHTGTHVDAPVHFLPSGEDVRSFDLASVVGPARVVAISDSVSVKREELEAVRPHPASGCRSGPSTRRGAGMRNRSERSSSTSRRTRLDTSSTAALRS